MPIPDAQAHPPEVEPLPDDPEAEEVQRVVNAYLNALIRGTREEQDESGEGWDEMAAKKDKENKGK